MDNLYEIENMSDQEAEATARTLGWRGEDEFNGDPEKFVPAKEFLDRANKNVPVMRENYKKIADFNNVLLDRVKGFEEKIDTLTQKYEEAEKRGYERALRDIEAKQEKAVIEGDTEAYKELKRRKEQLQQEQLEKTTRIATENTQRQDFGIPLADQIAIATFENQNSWFRQDPELNEDMRGFVVALKNSHPEMSMADVLEKAKSKVMKANPEKFNIKEKVSPVTGIGDGAASGGKLTYATIEPKMRDMFDAQWAATEKSMRNRHFNNETIEAAKKEFQNECLKIAKGAK